MTKFTAFILIVALRIAFHPSNAQSDLSPFTNTSFHPASIIPAKLISISGAVKNQKVILTWTVDENETADMFEVEKSSDGKTFTMAAIVFCTEKSEKAEYQFYEKAGNKKMLYRIKLINKNKELVYSEVIEINPNA